MTPFLTLKRPTTPFLTFRNPLLRLSSSLKICRRGLWERKSDARQEWSEAWSLEYRVRDGVRAIQVLSSRWKREKGKCEKVAWCAGERGRMRELENRTKVVKERESGTCRRGTSIGDSKHDHYHNLFFYFWIMIFSLILDFNSNIC